MSSAVAAPPVRTPSAVPGGAIAAVTGALVLAVCNVLSAFAPGAGSTRDLVAWFGANPGLTETVAATGLVATILLVPGIWAVTQRLRPMSPLPAVTGGWLTATGYTMGTVLSFESLALLSVLAAGGDPALLAAASDGFTTGTATAVYVVFGLGALIGTVLLGVAVLRQRGTVPAWAGWALVVSPVVRMAGLFTGFTLVGPPLASVLIAVGFAGVLFARR